MSLQRVSCPPSAKRLQKQATSLTRLPRARLRSRGTVTSPWSDHWRCVPAACTFGAISHSGLRDPGPCVLRSVACVTLECWETLRGFCYFSHPAPHETSQANASQLSFRRLPSRVHDNRFPLAPPSTRAPGTITAAPPRSCGVSDSPPPGTPRRSCSRGHCSPAPSRGRA